MKNKREMWPTDMFRAFGSIGGSSKSDAKKKASKKNGKKGGRPRKKNKELKEKSE